LAEKNGWAFGGESANDENDSIALYDIIEKEIAPLYYDLNENNIPEKWVEMMKNSIISITPKFSARRMMKEYADKFYIPISKKLMKEI